MTSMQPRQEVVNVICMKWGTKFGPEYVNILHNMVQRYLARPHRFICITDNAEGFNPGIESLPIPSAGPADTNFTHGWRKLAMFASPLGDLKGMTLFLDLDVVVVDRLDPLFEYKPGEICVVRDYRMIRVRGDDFVGNTSVLRFNAGEDPEVLADFIAAWDGDKAIYRNEQEFLSHWFHSRGRWQHWPDTWCPSFKHDCVALGPLSYITTPKIPEGAKVIVFHGDPKPEDALAGKGSKWYRKIRPTPWVSDYWR